MRFLIITQVFELPLCLSILTPVRPNGLPKLALYLLGVSYWFAIRSSRVLLLLSYVLQLLNILAPFREALTLPFTSICGWVALVGS